MPRPEKSEAARGAAQTGAVNPSLYEGKTFVDGEQDRAEIKMPAVMGDAGHPLTMSSREIIDLYDKRHDHVLRDIRVYVGAILQAERGTNVKSLGWAGKECVQVFSGRPPSAALPA